MAKWNEERRSGFDPDHDSIYQRFVQLETLLKGVPLYGGNQVSEALKLLAVLREQVLK